MRLCFYNPQAVQSILGDTLISRIFRTNRKQIKSLCKLDYLLEILKNPDIDTAIIVDGTSTSLFSPVRKSNRFNKLFIIKIVSFFEIYFWCLLNKINPLKQKIIFNINKLDSKNDLLFGFGALTNVFFDSNKIKKSLFKLFKGKKIIHLNHYFLDTKNLSKNLNIIKPDLYLSEADLSKNDYFKHFFNNKKVYILPYVLRDRYVLKKKFKNRKNICLALGTSTVFDASDIYKDFCVFFKTNTLQPMRNEIYINKNKITKFIDNYVYFGKSSLNTSFLKKIFNLKKVNKYFSFDVVLKFNNYKMFVSPEELIGVPSINFIEGMGCGCAYFGLKDFYKDLGLTDGVNYIAYDGSLEDLTNKIEYYQKHNKKLEKIAKNGYDLVRKNFNKDLVVEKFLSDMEKMFFRK